MTRSGRRALPFAYRLAVWIVRPLLMLLTKRDWQGAEHLPRSGGYVVTPNHISHLDPLTFAHFMVDNGREVYFLGKEAVVRVPVVGWIVRNAQQIPVHRNAGNAAEAFRSAVRAVEQGKAVGVYPDGTLTRDIVHSVAVSDCVRHRTIVLHAGQSYLAKPRKRGR